MTNTETIAHPGKDHPAMKYAGIADTATIRAYRDAIKRTPGMGLSFDAENGTVVFWNRGAVLFRALQKGRGGAWICRSVPDLFYVD